MIGGNRNRKKLLERFGKRKEGYFQMDGIKSYAANSSPTDKQLIINDRTWSDLDMDEVFMYLDRTSSAIGQQLLYARLRGISSFESTDDWEQLIEKLRNYDSLKEEAIVVLNELKDADAYLLPGLFQEDYLKKPRWYPYIRIMSFLAFASVPAMVFIPKLWLASFLILAINLMIHYWNKKNLMLYSRSMPYLLGLLKVSKRFKQLFAKPDAQLDESISQINELASALTIFKIEKGLQTDIGQVIEFFVELIKAYFVLEPITLFNTLERLEERKAHIEKLYIYVANTDTALSTIAIRNQLPTWCRPHFEDNDSLDIKGIYHPLIEEPVSNNLALAGKSILLTGSNMSGKTTFIRTVGLSALCANAINTCFCETYQAPALHVSSAIRIADDLMSDKSYFQEEMLVVKSMLEESEHGGRRLFLLDELMKGTNALERVAAGKAILDQLAKNDNLVMVATHDLELADLLQQHYDLYHFSEVIESDQIEFDYLLKPGKLTNTNAIRILEINGYPKSLTNEARRLVEQLKIR